jgi:5-methylcytosine-specific restriction endonuclease McrA
MVKKRNKSGNKSVKTPIKSLKKKAWETISKFVRARDKNICVTCGRMGNECGHYRHNSERNALLGGNMLWWNLKNLNCQCGYCNRWMSGNLDKYALYLENKYGQGILQEIQKEYNTPKKWTREKVEEIIEKYS